MVTQILYGAIGAALLDVAFRKANGKLKIVFFELPQGLLADVMGA